MEENGKILVSVYDGRDTLIDHIAVIRRPERNGAKLRAEIRARFQVFINKKEKDEKIDYLLCRFMFIYPSKENVEWITWNSATQNIGICYHPIKREFQTPIFYYKSSEGTIKFKTF